MGWNYRVIRRRYAHADGEIETTYGIHEVYAADDAATIDRFSLEPIHPLGEEGDGGLEALRRDLEMMQLALEKPILDYDDCLGQPMA